MPAPAGERRRQEPGVGGEENEGSGGDGGEDSTGSGNGEGGCYRGPSSGPGSGSGSIRPALRPALRRAQSTLQWSSESEDESEEASGATNDGDQAKYPAGGNGDDGGGSGKPMPCAVATPVLDDDGGSGNSSSSSYGQPRESFGLRFRGEGVGQGAKNKPPTLLSSTSEGPAASGGIDGGGAATSASAGSAGFTDDAIREGEEGRASGAGDKNRPLSAAGRVLRGARRALRWAADGLLVALVVKGSVPVVKNMAGVGGGQTMNRNFDRCAVMPLSRHWFRFVSTVY